MTKPNVGYNKAIIVLPSVFRLPVFINYLNIPRTYIKAASHHMSVFVMKENNPTVFQLRETRHMGRSMFTNRQ